MNKCKILFLFMAFLLATSAFSVQAASYRDVPVSHYAYDAVDWVSNPANGSFMVGDASNNFNPTRTLDKFEAAKIFAMAAGYKYAANSISPAEQELFNRSYAERKALLDGMAAQYAKWSKTADREIAYLLHKNILTVTDVSRFIKKEGNTENITTLTKQDAIVYMIRLDGKQALADAISLPYHTPYKDDENILPDYKKYLYYAKESGIASGSDGYINPTRDFTRAEMAQMFYNIMAHRPSPPNPSPAPSTQANGNTVSGVIDYVFADTHLYITSEGKPSAYKIASNAVIMVDNAQRTAVNLKQGMPVTALTNTANEIISLVARSNTEVATSSTSVTPAVLDENEGYVVSAADADNSALKIRTQRVKLTGEIVSDEKDYTIAKGVSIHRGGEVVQFADIKVNDVITFKHSGSEIFDIFLEEKDRLITGTLFEKKIIPNTETVMITIEDENRVKYELRVTTDTRFTRNGSPNVNWNDLRIGDRVQTECEYDRIIQVYATGSRTTTGGRLEEVRYTLDAHQITVRKDNGELSAYNLIPGAYDIYSLRIGMQLRLYLDSREIYNLDILS